jgi:hypothetical protein
MTRGRSKVLLLVDQLQQKGKATGRRMKVKKRGLKVHQAKQSLKETTQKGIEGFLFDSLASTFLSELCIYAPSQVLQVS